MTATKIVSLCPTFARPWMVANTLAQWVDQTHPIEQRHILVGDDTDGPGELSTARLRNAVRNARQHIGQAEELAKTVHYFRFPSGLSLPQKYNAMAEYALQWICPQADMFTVWEDDDTYLPAHLQQLAHDWNRRNRPTGWWGHPKLVWSDYSLEAKTEQAQGRFHAALALSVDAWKRSPWIETKSPDFDQQFLARLQAAFGGRKEYDLHVAKKSGNTYSTPTYMFRWHTRCPHGQQFMGDHGHDWQQVARAAMRKEFEDRRGYDLTCQKDLRTTELIQSVTDFGKHRVCIPQYLPEVG